MDFRGSTHLRALCDTSTTIVLSLVVLVLVEFCMCTFAKYLQAYDCLCIGETWLPIIASTNFALHVQKNKTPEKGTEKRLQPDKPLGLVFQRLKYHKEALHLELC